jgi:hypothetical protein
VNAIHHTNLILITHFPFWNLFESINPLCLQTIITGFIFTGSYKINQRKTLIKITLMNNNNNTNREITWQEVIVKYARPDLKKSIWQIFNSVVPYLFMWYIMYRSLEYPYWVTLLLSLLAVGFLIRVFIIFHDCGHRSFFKSRHANNIVGMIAGIMVLTPYNKWHRQHKIHHDTSANLDKRGVGDVWTMTVEEYQEATPWSRLVYRNGNSDDDDRPDEPPKRPLCT